jgi:hypothetical protein
MPIFREIEEGRADRVNIMLETDDMRSWKSHRLTSHTWLGLNPQIGRPLSRIVGAIGLFTNNSQGRAGIMRPLRHSIQKNPKDF